MVVLMLIVVFPGGSVVLVLLAVQRSFLVKAKVRGRVAAEDEISELALEEV